MKKLTTKNARSGICISLLGVFLLLLIAVNGMAQEEGRQAAWVKAISPDGNGKITFTPGLRIQTRYLYDQETKNNDIFVRRLRLKGKGRVFDLAKYYFEVKLDNAGRTNVATIAGVENAWLEFDLHEAANLRVGLYDVPFSRNALTSDSKLLFLDRSLVKNATTSLGMSDNTVGLNLHGRPFGQKFSYSLGVFDNLSFKQTATATTDARESKSFMAAGRFGFDLLDAPNARGYGDYKASYLGAGKRLTISANAVHLFKANIADNDLSLTSWGADLFFNWQVLTVEAEFDAFLQDYVDANLENSLGMGWYAQAGYIIGKKYELALRFQGLDPSNSVDGDKVFWTSMGFNYYIREHNLKVQTEYILKRETGSEFQNDVVQLQLQFDF